MTASKRRRNIKTRLLAEQEGRCWLCGMRLTIEASTIDHVIPTSKGGQDARANYRLAHWICNQIRSSVDADHAPAHVKANLPKMLTKLIRREMQVAAKRGESVHVADRLQSDSFAL